MAFDTIVCKCGEIKRTITFGVTITSTVLVISPFRVNQSVYVLVVTVLELA